MLRQQARGQCASRRAVHLGSRVRAASLDRLSWKAGCPIVSYRAPLAQRKARHTLFRIAPAPLLSGVTARRIGPPRRITNRCSRHRSRRFAPRPLRLNSIVMRHNFAL